MFALKSIPHGIKSPVGSTEVGLIGVDFALNNINLAQLEKTSKGKIVVKSCCNITYSQSREELLQSPKVLRPLIRQAIKEHGFKGKSVVSSMPSNDVRIFSIHYTKTKNSDDNASILASLQERIDEDVSEYVVDYLPIRSIEKDGDQLALVAVVKRELVISYLEVLRQCGLHVEALEIRPAAIKRLIYSIYQDQEYKNVLIINFGADKSFLTITSGRRLLFDQQLNFGADMVVEKMSDVLDMPKEQTLELIEKHGFEVSDENSSSNIAYSDEDITKTLLDIARPIFEELINEINRVLIFAASENHGESITKIFLLGSIANWNGVSNFLAEKLDISIEALQDPLSKFIDQNQESTFEYHPKTNMAIAAGLALKGMVNYE